MDPTRDPPRAPSRIFPIVGIGASAGGLEAISELLSRLPEHPGLALLVVQHLEPSRPSMLVGILSRHTTMAVEEAADHTLVEPDRVYVIPPGTRMTLAQGRLRIAPREASHGPPLPVDDLLQSLAQDRGSDAIGVVLSGTGTDGALGLQAIKAVGGLCFAQDASTARFDSMPRAAVDRGGVDRVLPPAAIADELVRVARQPWSAGAGVHLRPKDEELLPLFQHLRDHCNVDFSHYKRGTVTRRLKRRLALHGLRRVSDYLKIVERDPAEARALCRDLLVRYTEFFRDREAFAALSDTVFPRLLQHADPSLPLRIWVPGCATGEEVYSIAICLAEYMGRRSLSHNVQIFGTDISDDALDIARAARYPESIARQVSAERLARCFVKEGEHYRVVKSIRDQCTFARQNAAYDPPFSRIALISCRNLLIYLDAPLQKRVLAAFHYALRSDGLLMLGLSETAGMGSELFGVIESKRTKLFVKKAAVNPVLAALHLPRAVRPAADAAVLAPQEPQTSTPELLRRAVDRAALERYAPASVLCDDDFNVVEFRGDTGPFLTHPPGTPTSQLQRMARPGMFLAVDEALRRARRDGVAVREAGSRIDVAGRRREAVVDALPLQPADGGERWFLVFFTLLDDAAPHGHAAPPAFGQTLKTALLARVAGQGSAQAQAAKDRELVRLGAELRASREQARAMLDEHAVAVEELKALQEEIQSSNEEYQSSNEELETAKEELQSLNEELSTTNDELSFRNRELKTLHGAVSQARDYADAIIDTVSEPMLVLDGNLRVVRANRAFYDAFATTAGQTLQVALYSLGNGQWNIPPLRRLLEELLPQRTVVRDYEVTCDFPQIGRRTMNLNAVRLVWPDHALILLMLGDVTERRHAFAKLTDSDRQKDEFLAVLSHELRNPLAAMSNALRLWKHADGSAQVKHDAMAMLDRQLRNQVRMVNGLLDMSRITRGLVTLQLERLDLAQTLRQVHDALREQLDARGHTLRLALPPDGLAVDGDAVRLEQVVTNLLGNAIKFTPPGGHIELSLERQGDEAVLTVADDGIGMNEALLTEGFDIFVQADKSIERGGGGLGIGLAVVRRLVELHGGTVRAFSAGPLKGSRFVVRLPALAADAAAAVASAGVPPAAAPEAPAVARRVLVVDDNVDAGSSAASLLELDGHEVRVAHDGPAALDLAQRFRPDVVLLDIGMPGMDGYEVCRRLRRLPGQQDTLVVAVSGYGQREDVDLARAAGFDHHVTKPADPLQIAGFLRAGGRPTQR